jgi:hypothetical protein
VADVAGEKSDRHLCRNGPDGAIHKQRLFHVSIPKYHKHAAAAEHGQMHNKKTTTTTSAIPALPAKNCEGGQKKSVDAIRKIQVRQARPTRLDVPCYAYFVAFAAAIGSDRD